MYSVAKFVVSIIVTIFCMAVFVYLFESGYSRIQSASIAFAVLIVLAILGDLIFKEIWGPHPPDENKRQLK